MGVMDWVRELTGEAEKQRQAEADRRRQDHIDQQRAATQERELEKIRLASQEREAVEKQGQQRKSELGPAERAFPELASELRKEIRGDRQQEPEKPREVEPTRHEHQFNPTKPIPTMTMGGVKYVNRRAMPSQPAPEQVNQVEAEQVRQAKPEKSQQPQKTVHPLLGELTSAEQKILEQLEAGRRGRQPERDRQQDHSRKMKMGPDLDGGRER